VLDDGGHVTVGEPARGRGDAEGGVDRLGPDQRGELGTRRHLRRDLS
jgi:hypothetical protein